MGFLHSEKNAALPSLRGAAAAMGHSQRTGELWYDRQVGSREANAAQEAMPRLRQLLRERLAEQQAAERMVQQRRRRRLAHVIDESP